jgi:hypothetical protein
LLPLTISHFRILAPEKGADRSWFGADQKAEALPLLEAPAGQKDNRSLFVRDSL